MLVLSRKENEEIIVGENVSIKVLGVVGKKVRLGISAPNWISIRREEVDSVSIAMSGLASPPSNRRQVARCR